jgi:uncharacterized OB-fold protein
VSDGLRDYFKRKGAKPANPEHVAEYERNMREKTIPAIERAIKEQRQLRHRLIFGGAASPWTCPKCGRVWGPTVKECEPCNSKGPFGSTRRKGLAR